MSAVDGSRVDALVSGSYDGMLRIWTGAAAHSLVVGMVASQSKSRPAGCRKRCPKLGLCAH